MKFSKQQKFELAKISEGKLAGAVLTFDSLDIRKQKGLARTEWKSFLLDHIEIQWSSWVLNGKVSLIADLNKVAPIDLTGESKIAEDINQLGQINKRVNDGLTTINDVALKVDKLSKTLSASHQNSLSEIEGQLSKAVSQVVQTQKPDPNVIASAISNAVADQFEVFKQSSTPEQVKAVAQKTAKFTVKKAGEIFKGFTQYKVKNNSSTVRDEPVDFSDYPVEVFGDSKVIDEFYLFDPKHLHQTLIALNKNIPHNCWLAGQRGTGKSQFAEQLAGRLGRKFIRINFSADSDISLVGGFAPDPKNPPMSWQAGAVADAIQQAGALVLLDEVSFAHESNLAILQAVVERVAGRGLVVAETGKKISVADKVTFFVADNTKGNGDESGNHSGTRVMNQAFVDRFSYTMEFDYLPKKLEIDLLAKKSGCSVDVAEQIVEFAVTSRIKTEEGILTMPPSVRQLFGMADSIKDGLHPTIAFENSIKNKYPEDCYPELLAIFESKVNVKKLQGVV